MTGGPGPGPRRAILLHSTGGYFGTRPADTSALYRRILLHSAGGYFCTRPCCGYFCTRFGGDFCTRFGGDFCCMHSLPSGVEQSQSVLAGQLGSDGLALALLLARLPLFDGRTGHDDRMQNGLSPPHFSPSMPSPRVACPQTPRPPPFPLKRR